MTGQRASACGLSRLPVLARIWIRTQAQPPRNDVAGQIGQPSVMSICISTQPDKCLRDADAELLGEHPGSLIDLGAVHGQARGLAARPGPAAA